MNSETRETVEEYAKQAEAIVRCPVCGNYDIYAEDEEADKRAYGAVTNAWKAGQFGGDSREDIVRVMEGVLRDANEVCPSCGAEYED